MPGFERLLVYVATEPREKPALERAARLAERTGAAIEIVTAVERPPSLRRWLQSGGERYGEVVHRAAGECLEAYAEPLRARGLPVATTVLCGSPATEVARHAIARGSDVVLKTARPEEEGGPLRFGALGVALMRQCPCPVWIVQRGGEGALRRALAAVDPDEDDPHRNAIAAKVVRTAFDVAGEEGAEVHLAHAWQVFGDVLLRHRMDPAEFARLRASHAAIARERLDHFVAEYASSVPPERRHLLEGDPALVLPEFARAEHMDVVVMATMTREGVAGFVMGNVAERVVRRFQCSVLAVKPDAGGGDGHDRRTAR